MTNKYGQSLIFDSEDRDPKSKRRRLIANLIIASMVAAGWCYSFIANRASDMPPPASIDELRKEFASIGMPHGVSAVGGMDTTSKASMTMVDQTYVSTSPIDDVFDAYEQQLEQNGWSYLRRIYGGVNAGKIYCKKHIEANLEVTTPGGDNGGFQYDFSISSGDIARTDCVG